MFAKITLLLAVSLLLTACSPADLFSQLATSEVEQASYEVIQQQEASQQKLELIEAKKTAFPDSALLVAAEDLADKYQAIAFRNNYALDGQFALDIEALVPHIPDLSYLVWLKAPESLEYTFLGSLEQRGPNDFHFFFQAQDDLTPLSQVIISLDSDQLQEPQNMILVGAFAP